MSAKNTRDYAAAAGTVVTCVNKVSGKVLTRDQELTMAGSISLMLSREYEAGRRAGAVESRSHDHLVGSWLSAALEDPKVCREMKADIEAWLDATRLPPPAKG